MNKQDELNYLKHRIAQMENDGQPINAYKPQKKFRTGWFIVGVILFWPAALVYAIYYLATKDNP